MNYPKRSQYKHTKKPYRVRNWHAYEEGLRKRGDLTIWITESALASWSAVLVRRPFDPKNHTPATSTPVARTDEHSIRATQIAGDTRRRAPRAYESTSPWSFRLSRPWAAAQAAGVSSTIGSRASPS